MASFHYCAVNEEGARVTGLLAADSLADARAKLRAMRLFPERVAAAAAGGRFRGLPGLGRDAAMDVALFTRQCAVLVASGVPIVEALTVLSGQCEHRGLAIALEEAREAVNAGRGLAEALGAHPRCFDATYVGMVASGEKSGALDVVLARLADFLEARRRLHARVSTALIYPALLVVMGIALLIFLSGYVVPMIAPLLEQRGGPMPPATIWLIRVSAIVHDYWWALPAAILAGSPALRLARRSARGREIVDAAALRIPLLGRVLRKQLLARFTMTFATLLRTGVPAVEALEIMEEVTPNAVFRGEIALLRQEVIEGRDISHRMRESKLFPPAVACMTAAGERAGNLAEVLERVAQAYDLEVEIATRRLLATLEPALVLGMAVVVGFVAASLMLTILELSNI